MNYAFLGWLAKIPGIGHLWFVTMIALCYVACVVVSRLFAKDWGRKAFPWALLLGCGGLYGLLSHFGLPAYMAFILFYYSLLFAYADRVLDWLQGHARFAVGLGVPAFILLAAAIFVSGLLSSGEVNLVNIGCSLCGLAVLLVMLAVFSGTSDCPRAMSGLSGISYEWYLVHHPMVIGPVALSHILPSRPVAVLCYWALSLGCAILLKFLSSLFVKQSHA
jgi:peptidoglycan/LPS O-acetylase OafA/YrhL